jgi:hypothetical protein
MQGSGASRQETQLPNSDAASAADADEGLDLDTVFRMLKNHRRRHVVRYLRRHDGVATLSDLAEHMAASEEGTTVEALTSRQRKRVYVSLYQGHLPKMDDADVIEYDRDRGSIEAGPHMEDLETYLDMCDGGADDGDWFRYQVLGVGAGWLLFATSHLDAVQAYGLRPDIVLVVVLAVLTGLTVVRGMDEYARRRSVPRALRSDGGDVGLREDA